MVSAVEMFNKELNVNMTDQTLDPEDWESVRSLGHTMMDDMIDYLRDVRTRKVWQPFPDPSKEFLTESLPQEGLEVREVYDQFKTHIFPYTKGNIHPRFWAWVQGTGTPMGVLADMMASAMNPNATIGEQSPLYVDLQVIEWCKEMMNFPKNASGMLLSGASMANTTALIVARNVMLAHVRKDGLQSEQSTATIYTSTETHSCITKAGEVIGLGENNIKKIPVDDAYMVRTDLLEKEILQDKMDGKTPFCIVANAGTVNTGSIDDLKAIYEISKKHNLWFHIDGAFGALAKMLPEYAEILRYIEKADSVAFDLHKWMYMPYEVGCVLIHDRQKHRNTFAIQPAYLLNHERGLAAGPDSLNHYGIELSRGFKALKVWMSLKEHGIQKYVGQIEKNILQARYLGLLAEHHPSLELMAPIPLNVVCFRYNDGRLSDKQLDQVNKEIVMSLQEQGIASPSSTFLHGKYCIRVAITNHRSIREDFDILVESVINIGASVVIKA